MQKKFIAIYFLIFAMLLIVMNLSQPTNDNLRERSVALLAPLWERILSVKYFVNHPSQPSPFSSLSPEEERQSLQVENRLLDIELSYLQKQLDEQLFLSSKIAQVAAFSTDDARLMALDYQKSLQKMLKITKLRLKAVPARVIFRTIDTWNSSLWINVGKNSHEIDEEGIVSMNSPVVIGNAIIGLIDYVGKHQSRVRLITDNRLTPSVRAARGGEQEALIHSQIESLLHQMNHKKTYSLSSDDYSRLLQLLTQLKENLQPLKKTWYLAKGELQGSTVPYRLNQNVFLKGSGFNYDYADEEGESRDLRNGKSLLYPQNTSIPILKTNDVLVTTGMDGIFPPGFQVAFVSHVGLLKEGDYFYDLEARPVAPSLEELTLVFVLPPLNSDLGDRRLGP